MTALLFINISYLFDKKELKVYFLDIGQGDSELIISPRGVNTLIDTGPNQKIVEVLEEILSRVTVTLDGVVLTHQDLDHMGGFEYIDKAFHVKSLYISENYTLKQDFLNKNNVSQGDVLDMADLKLEIVSPKKGETGSTNHTSIVSVLKYGNFRFIFMADADKEIERKLLSEGYFNDNSYIDILKLGHHGSETSSSESFLKKIKPEYCIISVGKSNKYNLPSEITVSLAKKYCKSIYRTDEDGSVGFFTDGKVLKIKKSL